MENVVGLHYTAPDVGSTKIFTGVGLTNYVTDMYINVNEIVIIYMYIIIIRI